MKMIKLYFADDLHTMLPTTIPSSMKYYTLFFQQKMKTFSHHLLSRLAVINVIPYKHRVFYA